MFENDTFKIVFTFDVFLIAETTMHCKDILYKLEKNPEGLYKIELCRQPIRHQLFLSCNCHGVTDLTCKQKS
jgi:hypothetical protein